MILPHLTFSLKKETSSQLSSIFLGNVFLYSIFTLTGFNFPVSSSSSVLFPTPLGPTIQTRGRTEKSTLRMLSFAKSEVLTDILPSVRG